MLTHNVFILTDRIDFRVISPWFGRVNNESIQIASSFLGLNACQLLSHLLLCMAVFPDRDDFGQFTPSSTSQRCRIINIDTSGDLEESSESIVISSCMRSTTAYKTEGSAQTSKSIATINFVPHEWSLLAAFVIAECCWSIKVQWNVERQVLKSISRKHQCHYVARLQ